MTRVVARSFALEDVVGRESELDRIRAHLDGQEGPLVLLLAGAPGIGKTTLWRAGVELALERDFRVLACRPTETETAFSFAALRDLLADVVPEVLRELPPPQRRAIDVALALASSGDQSVSEGLLGTALLSVVQLLALQSSVLVAIDDVQWLDSPSASIIQFAARRFRGDRIKLLITARRNSKPSLLRLERDLAAELQRVEVGPLSLGAVHRLVRSRLGASLSRPMLRRIHQVSGGNPFYALEIARSPVERSARVRPGEPLPIPGSLGELVGARLSKLPAKVRAVLDVAALLAEPTRASVAAAVSEPESVARDIDSAVAAGVVELDGERLRFTHPLLAAATVSALPEQRRRALHARLARIAEEPEEQARHLAAGSDSPDSGVATVLEEAGRDASLRGAPAAAAELAELAAERTPTAEREARWRRLNEAGLRWATSGDVHRARQILEPLIDELPAGSMRTEVFLNLADCRWDDHAAAVELAERALSEVGNDDACRARIHMLLSSHFVEAGGGPALAHIRAAHDAAVRSGDQQLALLALVNQVHVEACAGALTEGLVDHALIRLRAESEKQMWIPQFESPHLVLGLALHGLGRFVEARAEYQRALAHAAEQGVAFAAACAHMALAEVGSRLGEWDEAQQHAGEAGEHYEQLGLENQADALYVIALTHAQVGNVNEARSSAERGAAIAASEGQDLWGAGNRSVLGFLELSLGNPAAAVSYLRPPEPSAAIDLWHFPIYHDLVVNAVEALVGVGGLDAAANLVGVLDERARKLDNTWERATRARSRGLVCAERGDADGAFGAFEAALREHDQLETPLDRARTLLALGRFQRRLNQKRAGRSSLEAALDIFEELGATLWAQQARNELNRIGGRAPSRNALTPTELRVAELVAQGLPNKEIATTLVVTVKAVEANLTRIYAKLGMRSRTELTRLMHQQHRPRRQGG